MSTMKAAKTSTRSPRRRWLAVALAALAGAVLAGACAETPADSARGRPPVPVLTASAVSRNMPVRLSEIGMVEPYVTVAVTPRVGGQIERIAFAEGQDVAAGDILFEIDSAPYAAQLAAARANLARDRAKLANAVADSARYTDLVTKDYVTQQAYDAMVATASAARATVAADSAAVVSARLDVQYCTIRSPIAGRTGSYLVQQGNVVAANGASLVTINQIAPIYVSFTIPESRLAEVRRYSQAGSLEVTASLPTDSDMSRSYQGTLTFVDNAVDGRTGTILLKATFPNRDRALWPGQFARIDLMLTEQLGATVVPTSAVQPSQQGDYVYVVRPDSTVEVRSVVAGARSDGQVVIAQGVEPGETIVTDGQLRLTPGARVSIKTGLVPPGVQAGGAGVPSARADAPTGAAAGATDP